MITYTHKLIYSDYVKKMISEGWKVDRKILTEKDLNVKTFSYNNVGYDCIIIMQCPSENIMSICGTDSIPDYDDITKPHTIQLKLENSKGIEISPYVTIMINKESNDGTLNLERKLYDDIKVPYEFKYAAELGREFYDGLYIYAVTNNNIPSFDIDKDKIKLNLEIDVWSK